MRFAIPKETLERLRSASRMRDVNDDVTTSQNAFLLEPGLGPGAYLTNDGRVLIDGRYWDQSELREATDDEAIAALVVGAFKTGISELLALLPTTPHHAVVCETCAGSRWVRAGTDVLTGEPGQMLCYKCRGRGWVQATARSV
jgi:hypothetical protein